MMRERASTGGWRRWAVALALSVPIAAWGQAQPDRPEVPPAAGAGGPGAVAGGPGAGAGGPGAVAPGGVPLTAPMDPFMQVAPARAAAAGARVRVSSLRDELSDHVRIQRMLFENSAAYRAATAKQQQAWDVFDTARNRLLESLEVDPEVRQMRLLLADVARQVEANQRRLGDPDLPAAVATEIRAQLAALADYRLSLARQLSATEAAALRDDPATREARQQLAQATAELDQLKREFEVRLRASPELASGRRALREAREQHAAAAEYAAAAARTADLLLDYAYYVQWATQRRSQVIVTPWISYGYPLATVAGPAAVPAGTTGIGFGMMPYQSP